MRDSSMDDGPARAKGAETTAGIEESGLCLHCRQAILTPHTDDKGAVFCCAGCLKVHEFLGTNGWEKYYDLLEQGGRKPPRAAAGEEYAALLQSLSDPRVLAGMGRHEGGRHALTLESMDIVCAACGWLLENVLRDTPGVRAFEVDFLHGELFLDYETDRVSLADLLATAARFGYRFKPKPPDTPTRPRPDRSLLARLAVSGACAMNSMSFAAATYAGAFQDMDQTWQRIFGWMGFAVTLPAVAYSAYPFYAGAWRAARMRHFSIDVTVTIGIALSFAVTVASVLGGEMGNYSDSLSGLVFFLLLGRWAVQRFEAGLALKGRWFDALRKGRVRVRRDGAERLVECGEVKAGETIAVGRGEYLPLDGIVESPRASVDAGLLTGESRPVDLRAGDPVFAGSLNLKDTLSLIVTGSSGYTRVEKLGRELEDLAAHRRPLPDNLAKVAGGFTIAVLLAGLLAFLLHLPDGALHASAVAASVFIISCSCALALAGPICRGLGLKRAQALGYHFKSQASLESLQGIRCVLFDKTGTLTFTHRTVSGWTWTSPWQGSPAARSEALRALGELTRHSLHPVAASLARALDGQDSSDRPALIRVREIPHFGMVAHLADPTSSFHEICLCRRGAWEDKDGAFAGLGYRAPDEAIAGTAPGTGAADSCLFLDGRLAALIRFTDEVRPEVPDLVQALEARGITPVLLSGDNQDKVEAFAKRCGFAEWHGALAPEDKKKWARQYQTSYGRCLAVGDGFNDSLLFGVSDLAMAVQGGAVDLSAATDILSTGDRPMALDRLFTVAAGVRRGIRACWWISGAYNIGAVAAAMAGWVTPLFAAILMPVSSLSLCLAAWLSLPRE